MNDTTPSKDRDNQDRITDSAPTCTLSHPETGTPCTACGKAAAVDREIEEIEKKLREIEELHIALKDKQIVLAQEANADHDRLTTRLPLEIVDEIFHHCVHRPIPEPGDLDSDNDAYWITTFTPLTLAAVCTMWRRLVHAMPSLWSSIQIPLHCRAEDNTPIMSATTLRNWLDRTGKLPLSITFTSDSSPIVHLPGHVQQLINLTREHVSNWKELTVYTTASYHPFFGYDSSCMVDSSLQTLRLYTKSQSGLPRPEWSFNRSFCLPHTPFLTHVKLYNFLLFRHEWRTVTHFTANILDITVFREILRDAPDLTHCKVTCLLHDFHVDPFHQTQQSTQLIHSPLRHLEIENSHRGPLYDLLRLPKLSSFVYNWAVIPLPVEQFHTLFPLFSNHGSQLTHLTMNNLGQELDVLSPHLPLLFRTLENLVYLKQTGRKRVTRQHNSTAAEPLFLRILGHDEDAGFLPKLEVLELSYYTGNDFSWKSFCNIFTHDLASERARLHNTPGEELIELGRPLRRVWVGFHHEPMADKARTLLDEQTLRRLIDIRTAGIDLKIDEITASGSHVPFVF